MPPQDWLCLLLFLLLFSQNWKMHNAWDINCKGVLVLSHIPIGVNTATITTIAYERFFVVFFPLKAKLFITFKKMQIIAIIIWVSCILTASLDVYFAMVKEPSEPLLGYCYFTSYFDKDLLFFAFAVPSFTTSSTTCIAYISIGCL